MNKPSTMPRAARKAAVSLPDNAPLEALPPHWQREITKLRRENAKTRIELREARSELGEDRQRIATLMLDLADLRDGLRAQTDGK